MHLETNLSIEEQLEAIKRGAEEIFPEEELRDKLKRSIAEKRPLRVKLGIDPTAVDLHIGHMIPVLKMRQFQELGHHCILIIGDYTATVGDPSGRNKTRPQLTHEEVVENAKTYQEQFFKLVDPKKTEVVYNGEWFSKMKFGDVLGLLAKMTVARMLEREDFANRYQNQQPISIHELVYPLMQGYDSAMIKADVELGGIDQKFNILVGRDIQKSIGQEPQVGVCNPILLGTDGHEKMSKSLNNYIGLNDSCEDMYGKLMSIPDDMMWEYFRLLTEMPIEEIAKQKQGVLSNELHPRDVKMGLAFEVTKVFHGEEGAKAGEAHFKRVFSERQLPKDIDTVKIEATELTGGKIWIVRLLGLTKLAASNGEARRFVQQGAVRIDGETILDPDFEWAFQPGAVLQVGKRRFAKIEME